MSSGNTYPQSRWECAGSCCDRGLLAEPLKFPTATALTAPNRYMKAAMSEQLCHYDKTNPQKSGFPSKLLLELYSKFAQGASGILVTGGIMVNPNALEAPGNVILHKSVESPEGSAAFHEWTQVGKSNGALMIAQLLHPGAQAAKCAEVTSFDPGKVTKQELEKVLDEFVSAGLHAEAYGFDGVELPCAYEYTLGYLATFGMNQRVDDYGGSFPNRVRALFRIIDGLRVGARNNTRFIIGVKLHAANLAPGFNGTAFSAFVKRLEDHGVDYISFSGGNLDLLKKLNEEERQSLNTVDATYWAVATTLKNLVTKTRIFLNAGVTLCDMSDVLRRGWADGVAIGRPLAAEPALPHKLLCGVVTGSIKSLVEDDDYLTACQIAGTQMWQHATNNAVMDTSNVEHLAKFKICLARHEEAIRRATLDQPIVGYAKLLL